MSVPTVWPTTVGTISFASRTYTLNTEGCPTAYSGGAGPMITPFVQPTGCPRLTATGQITLASQSSECYPPNFPAYWTCEGNMDFYSPAVCPRGYTYVTARNGQGPSLRSGETASICCPSSYTLAGGSWCATGTNTESFIAFQVRWASSDIPLLFSTTITTSTSSSSRSSTTRSSTTTSRTAEPTPSPSGLSTGAKAGIGAGVGIAALAALVALVFFCLRRRRNARAAAAVTRRGDSPEPMDAPVLVENKKFGKRGFRNKGAAAATVQALPPQDPPVYQTMARKPIGGQPEMTQYQPVQHSYDEPTFMSPEGGQYYNAQSVQQTPMYDDPAAYDPNHQGPGYNNAAAGNQRYESQQTEYLPAQSRFASAQSPPPNGPHSEMFLYNDHPSNSSDRHLSGQTAYSPPTSPQPPQNHNQPIIYSPSEDGTLHAKPPRQMSPHPSNHTEDPEPLYAKQVHIQRVSSDPGLEVVVPDPREVARETEKEGLREELARLEERRARLSEMERLEQETGELRRRLDALGAK